MDMTNARERAEELLQNLQKRARELLDSDNGLAKSVRTLIDEKGMNPAEARRRLDDTLARLKANPMVQKLNLGEIERVAGSSFQRLIDTLPVASKADLEDIGKQVKVLHRKVNDLAKKMNHTEAETH